MKQRDVVDEEELLLFGPKSFMSLKQFRLLLVHQLLNFERSNIRRQPNLAREEKKKTKNTPPKSKQHLQVTYTQDKNGRNKKTKGSKDSHHRPTVSVPPSIRYDVVGHFPEVGDKGRCRLCGVGQTVWRCSKCQTRLCLKTDKNCFIKFHRREE